MLARSLARTRLPLSQTYTNSRSVVRSRSRMSLRKLPNGKDVVPKLTNFVGPESLDCRHVKSISLPIAPSAGRGARRRPGTACRSCAARFRPLPSLSGSLTLMQPACVSWKSARSCRRGRCRQLADTTEVLAFAKSLPGLVASVLVPNLKGAEKAIAEEAYAMLLPLSASHAHSLANLRKTPDEVVQEIGRIRAFRDAAHSVTRLEVGISTAFGCTSRAASKRTRSCASCRPCSTPAWTA